VRFIWDKEIRSSDRSTWGSTPSGRARRPVSKRIRLWSDGVLEQGDTISAKNRGLSFSKRNDEKFCQVVGDTETGPVRGTKVYEPCNVYHFNERYNGLVSRWIVNYLLEWGGMWKAEVMRYIESLLKSRYIGPLVNSIDSKSFLTSGMPELTKTVEEFVNWVTFLKATQSIGDVVSRKNYQLHAFVTQYIRITEIPDSLAFGEHEFDCEDFKTKPVSDFITSW
jgi:hypothetical protein